MKSRKRAKPDQIGKAVRDLIENIPDHFRDFKKILDELKEMGVVDVKIIHVLCECCGAHIQTDIIKNTAPKSKRVRKSKVGIGVTPSDVTEKSP